MSSWKSNGDHTDFIAPLLVALADTQVYLKPAQCLPGGIPCPAVFCAAVKVICNLCGTAVLQESGMSDKRKGKVETYGVVWVWGFFFLS